MFLFSLDLILEDEERNFQKSVLHFVNALRIQEKSSSSDLLHFVDVCTDTSNVVTKQYLGEGKLNVN